MPKFYLQTFGCQMNKNDSERIVGLLCEHGFTQISEPDSADLLIVNTCSVRQSAEDRVFGLVHNWQNLREKNPNLIIAVTGCMPGRDKDGKLKNRITGADLFFGIEELPMLPGWLNGLVPGNASFCHPERSEGSLSGGQLDRDSSATPQNGSNDYLQITPVRPNRFQAFVTIQTGCNNFCTYCVVPEARGREKNRPVKEILEEIKGAVAGPARNASHSDAGGTKEITLLGQVVNNYKAPDADDFSAENPFVPQDPSVPSGHLPFARGGQVSPPSRGEGDGGGAGVVSVPSLRRRGIRGGPTDGDHFAALLWEINKLPGNFRVHFTAPDPRYFNACQIEALKLPKQVNYLHLAVQSGDNEILRKMNRKYTREEYIDLIKKIRVAKPEIAIGTDLIVGFCGETEEQFQNTLNLYRECDFDIAYTAQYSERSDTAAAKASSALSLRRRGEGEVSPFDDSVPKETKKRRWDELQAFMEEMAFRKNQKYIGRTVEVLVEKCEDGVCSGNSSEMKLTQFLGTPDMVGQFVKIKITQAFTWVLRGERIQ